MNEVREQHLVSICTVDVAGLNTGLMLDVLLVDASISKTGLKSEGHSGVALDFPQGIEGGNH